MTSQGSTSHVTGVLWQIPRNQTPTRFALERPIRRSRRPGSPGSARAPRAFRLPVQAGQGRACHVVLGNVIVLQWPGIHKTAGRDVSACACVRSRATTCFARTSLASGTDVPRAHGCMTSRQEAYHSAMGSPARTRWLYQMARTSSPCHAKHSEARASQGPPLGGAHEHCFRGRSVDTTTDEHGQSHVEAIGRTYDAGPLIEGGGHRPRLNAGSGIRAATSAGAWFALGCFTGIALACQVLSRRGWQAPVEPCPTQGHALAPLPSERARRCRRPEAEATLPRPHRTLQGIAGSTAGKGYTPMVHQAVPWTGAGGSSAPCDPAMQGRISHTCEPPPCTSSKRMMHSGVLAADVPGHTVSYSGSSILSCTPAFLATEIAPGARGGEETETPLRQESVANSALGTQSVASSNRKVNAWATAAAHKVLPSVVHLSVDREVEHQSQGSPWSLGPLLLRGPGGPHATLEKPAVPFLDGLWQSWARQASPSTVVERSYASGIVIASANAFLVVTNAHVVAGATGVWARGRDDALMPARVIGMHEVADVALLEVPCARGEARFSPAAIGDSSELEIGDAVLCFGSPIGLCGSLSLGVISSLHRTSQDIGIVGKSLTLLQTDCAMNPGSSGGPLVNEFGEVIGMNTAIRADAEGVAFAIPIADVMQVVERLMASDHSRYKSL